MTQEAAKKERVAKVIEVLNKARSMELYAVHQYMNQHYNLDDLDYGEFASKIKLIAIDEMRHAEQFAERIKEFKEQGVTQRQAYGRLGISRKTFERILEEHGIDYPKACPGRPSCAA